MNGRFERLEHHMPQGGETAVPFYVNPEQDSSPEALALLKIAEVVAISTQQEGFMKLDALLDKLGDLLSNPDVPAGLIIENEDGLGSVLFKPEVTKYSAWGKQAREVPTSLVFNMLYTMQTYNEQQAVAVPIGSDTVLNSPDSSMQDADRNKNTKQIPTDYVVQEGGAVNDLSQIVRSTPTNILNKQNTNESKIGEAAVRKSDYEQPSSK